MKLTKEQKNLILKYLDEENLGVFNKDVENIVAPDTDVISETFTSSAELLLWFTQKGIEAVENGVLTLNQLLGKEPISR